MNYTNEEVSTQTLVSMNRISFDRFWLHSRYNSIKEGLNVRTMIKQNFNEMIKEGGFVSFLECTIGNNFAGSMVVFKDPGYWSMRRDDVACFGLITVRNTRALECMLEGALDEIEKNGYSAIRGPVNSPRTLFGYGIQVSGFDQPIIAGTSSNPPAYAVMFAELDKKGLFTSQDRYINCLQDFGITNAHIATLDLDRNFQVKNPDFDDCVDILQKIATMMNDTLGYRPDYQATNPLKLASAVKMYKLVPDAEKLVGLFYDGDSFVGAVLMQFDWFQVLARVPVTTIIGDIYMLAKEFQGRNLFFNFSEYSEHVLAARGTEHYEHASIWEHTDAIISLIKKGILIPKRDTLVFEMHL